VDKLSRQVISLLLQRWEFFIGDPPQPSVEGGMQQPRPPIEQLRVAEQSAMAGNLLELHRQQPVCSYKGGAAVVVIGELVGPHGAKVC
jgi:hypothetical protein